MNKISFDIETLGNNINAPIVQLGACKFDIEGKIGDTFVRTVDPKSLEDYPELKVDYDTLEWWLNQDDDAIKSVFGYDLEKVSLKRAMFDYIDWIGNVNKYKYWSHATFDPPRLDNNFRVVGATGRVPFRNYRDIRTLNEFTGRIDVGERKGIHHNALDDAKFQANYISAGLRRIQEWKN